MSSMEKSLALIEDFTRSHSNYKFVKTASPYIYCSSLPNHWRSNKSLPSQFMVIVMYPVDDGTRVTITAGNEENDIADVKNNAAEVQQQVAKFSDLRFVGKSGRGKNFNLTITIHRKDTIEVAVASSVIKVTVDGPRDSRNANKYSSSPYPHHFLQKRPMQQPLMYPMNSLALSMASSSSIAPYEVPIKRERLDNQVNSQLMFAPHNMGPFKGFPPSFNLFNPVLAAMNQHVQPSLMNQANLLYLIALQQAMSNNANNSGKQTPEANEQKKEVWRPFP